MMASTYLTLDDPRIELRCTRPGRVYSLVGPDRSPDYPYPHSVHANGFHIEPRMDSVFTAPKSFNLNPGDYARLSVENTPLLGIVLELADHHYDLRVLIDGEDIYQGFGSLSCYLPSADGIGHVRWLLLDRAEHEITLLVSDQANRMLSASDIQPSHACISGFLLLDEIRFPAPVYHHWMYTQDPLPPDTRGRVSSFSQSRIPAGELCYLMDLPGQGTVESLAFETDQPLILEIMDGGAAQAEYPHDFPSWIRRADLGKPDSGGVRSAFQISERAREAGTQILMTKPLDFASRLIIRLNNTSGRDASLTNFHLEGSYRCL